MVDLSHMNEKGFWDIAAITDAPLVATHSNAHTICGSTRNLTDRQLDAIAESDGMVGLNYNCAFLRPDQARDSDTPLEVLADHIDYLVERIGIDRVGLGSDFDGAQMPNDLSDASKLPNLIAVLRARGYDDAVAGEDRLPELDPRPGASPGESELQPYRANTGWSGIEPGRFTGFLRGSWNPCEQTPKLGSITLSN